MKLFMLELAGAKLIALITVSSLASASSFAIMAVEIRTQSVSRWVFKEENQTQQLATPQPVQQIEPVTVAEQIQQETQENTANQKQAQNKKTASTQSGANPDANIDSNHSSGFSSDNSSTTDSSDATNADSNSNSGSSSQNDKSSDSATSNIFGQYSATSISSIVSALQLVLNDATGDYNNPGGGHPPSGVYSYAPIDQDDILIGVRNGRIYFKWTLSGTIPTSRQTIDSDTIKSVTFNIKIGKEEHPGVSNNCGGTAIATQINIQYLDNGQIWYNPWFNSICTNSGPYTSDHDWAFQNTGNGLAHTSDGGIGKNAIVYSYLLADFGNLAVGDSIKITSYSEAESNNWEHYSFDSGPLWTDWTVAGI